ncbi:MAG: DnaJ domain-containing protein [Gammaproteobacteria bacterium]|nr:DnaJ domain-containing protein [Gammaproteobacteria bacterium]
MNPYEILGVSSNADQNEIKSAWKKLAVKYHPDRNADPSAVGKLQEINQAYELIKTPEKRQMYDQGSKNQQGFAGFDNSDFIYQHFADIFKRAQATKSFNINVEVTIDEVATGKRISNTINLDGEEIELDFAIPAGVPDGARFNVKQLKSKMGFDVTISVTVITRQEMTRQRHGNDVLILQNISAFDAILGTEVEIEPISGHKLKLKIPKGTQPDTKLIMRGAGLPVFNSDRKGNVVAIIKISIPTDLDENQLDLLDKMR